METNQSSKKINILVHPNEAWLINKIRDYRFGELTIVFADGIPMKIRKSILEEVPPKDNQTKK